MVAGTGLVAQTSHDHTAVSRKEDPQKVDRDRRQLSLGSVSCLALKPLEMPKCQNVFLKENSGGQEDRQDQGCSNIYTDH